MLKKVDIFEDIYLGEAFFCQEFLSDNLAYWYGPKNLPNVVHHIS